MKTPTRSLQNSGKVSRSAKKIYSKLKEDSGSVSIEYVLWLPLFILLVFTIVDVSLMFTANARMWDAAREGARRMAIHNMTPEQTATYIEEKLSTEKRTYEVTTNDSGNEVDINVQIGFRDAAVFGHMMGDADWGKLSANVIMLKEPV